jgi:hypothetical protein
VGFISPFATLAGYLEPSAGASGYADNSGYSSNDSLGQPNVQKSQSDAPAAAPKRTFPSRPWNEEFQVLMAQWNDTFSSITNESSESQRLLQIANSLQTLVVEFENRALEIGELIISELHLPNNRRSILPVDAGGVAGGEKCTSLYTFRCFPSTSSLSFLFPIVSNIHSENLVSFWSGAKRTSGFFFCLGCLVWISFFPMHSSNWCRYFGRYLF